MKDFQGRFERQHEHNRGDDQRTDAERDRDRILYSDHFRRLAGVTQVASPIEGDVFHNRLTHSMKVGQVARRLAQWLKASDPEKTERLGGLDPEVTEAAALAHDLGHPPFGHIAEEELDKLVATGNGDKYGPNRGGYEGNAQSFRIVTKLATVSPSHTGLNLTRATLNAITKYPWQKTAEGKRSKKFGHYQTEEKCFQWARQHLTVKDRKTLEAEVMDWSDDITYSVHDTEDFYLAGLIPLDRLRNTDGERNRFFEGTKKRWEAFSDPDLERFGEIENAFERLADFFPVDAAYNGAGFQRMPLAAMRSVLVGQYLRSMSLSTDKESKSLVTIDQTKKDEVKILKELTWNYVILRPELAGQQEGYRRVIHQLFEVYADALADRQFKLVPRWFTLSDEMKSKTKSTTSDGTVARVAADIVSTLTDKQAIAYYHRIVGISPGNIGGFA